MSLWQSYRNLPQRTKLIVGGGIIAWGAFGLFLSDKVEKAYGLTPTEHDRQKLKEAIPKVHLVDKEK